MLHHGILNSLIAKYNRDKESNKIMTKREQVLETAKSFLGKNERQHTEELQKVLGINPATTPWCAAFVNMVLGKNDLGGTKSNLARSFLKYGHETDEPKPGDIVVFTRTNSPVFGHVGFYIREEGNNIVVLGGNQADGVNYSNYSKGALLGFRSYE